MSSEFTPTGDGLYQSPNILKTKLRKRGYTTCSFCDGMGSVSNRYTHVICACPRCQGDGLTPPNAWVDAPLFGDPPTPLETDDLIWCEVD